jgi:transcriptional regulator with XRE-family HTH domain
LARAVDTAANTVSRWETASYKPSIFDLETLARFFGVPIIIFSPCRNPSQE